VLYIPHYSNLNFISKVLERLFLTRIAYSHTYGANSMGTMRAMLWGRCPKVAAQEFCYVAVVHSQMLGEGGVEWAP